MQCPQCQHENPPQSKFCLDCGARRARKCPSCGIELPAGAKFCNECGQALAAVASGGPRRALHAALGIRTALGTYEEELQVRQGLGDTTNVAARLLQAANLGGGPRISTADSPVSVWMIPTNEEMMIASHTLACIRP